MEDLHEDHGASASGYKDLLFCYFYLYVSLLLN